MHICTPSEFLTALWGPTPHTRILVCTMSERRSHWLRDPKEADRAWDGDTYTGAALPGPTVKLEDNVRGEAKQAGAIAGLWVDVDYEDEHAHRKANLPSFVEARDFVQGVDPTPTITVRSGHGYQLWWLFKGGPWVFKSDTEREEAERLCEHWQSELRRRLGKALDSTHDVSRGLRRPARRCWCCSNNRGRPTRDCHPMFSMPIMSGRVLSKRNSPHPSGCASPS